jgi:hypothetical protein
MFLGDTSDNKRFRHQALLGTVDGTNKAFYVFNVRLVEDPEPKFHVKTEVGTSDVDGAITDPLAGEVELDEAPEVGSIPEISGAFFFWTDEELTAFLRFGCAETLGLTDTSSIPVGLQVAVLYAAASKAYNALSTRFTESRSSQFHLTERQEDGDSVDKFMKLSERYAKEAITKRDEYYTRQGRNNEPAMSIISEPKRSFIPRR